MRTKSRSIITADGPTSVFVVGKDQTNILSRMKHAHIERKYKKKRAAAEAQIVAADSHSMEELIAYVTDQYGAQEAETDSRQYISHRKSCKASLVLRYRPELLGEAGEIGKPDHMDEEAIREFMEKAEERIETAAAVTEGDIANRTERYNELLSILTSHSR